MYVSMSAALKPVQRYPDITPTTIFYIFEARESTFVNEPNNAARAKKIVTSINEFGQKRYKTGLELSWDKPPASIRTGFRIGCDPSCEIFIPTSHRNLETINVSRVHCRIHFNPVSGLPLLTDCSKDGTEIIRRGVHIKHLTPEMPTTVLESGWSIIIGGFYILNIVIPWTASNCARYIKELCEQVPTVIDYPPSPVPILSAKQLACPRFLPDNKKYREWKMLGSGAFGQVALLVENRTGALVVGKSFIEGSTRTTVHKREIDILKRIRHPYVVCLLDEVQLPSGNSTIVMEYSPYGDLRNFELRDWTDSEKLESFRQLLNGLRYLHSESIMHRDIKPANILVTSRHPLRLKFIDFGFSKQVATPMSFLGTPGFVAPECDPLRNDQCSYPADVYALGVTFLSFYYTWDELFEVPEDEKNPQRYYFKKKWHSRVRKLAEEAKAKPGGQQPEAQPRAQPEVPPEVQLLCGMTYKSPIRRWTTDYSLSFVTRYADSLLIRRPKRKLNLDGPNNRKKPRLQYHQGFGSAENVQYPLKFWGLCTEQVPNQRLYY